LLSRLVDHEQDLQPRLGLEASGRAHRVQPVGEFLDRLEMVLRRQLVEDPPGLLRIGHRMVGLAAEQVLEHGNVKNLRGRA
jgi:hypothetical protein